MDLSNAYSFDAIGSYTVQLEMQLQFFDIQPTDLSVQKVSSNAQEFQLRSSRNQPKMTIAQRNTCPERPSVSFGAGGPNWVIEKMPTNRFVSSNEEYIVKQAYLKTFETLTKVVSIGVTTKKLAKPYAEWFGESDAKNGKVVGDNFKKMATAMNRNKYSIVLYGPDCTDGIYAYTITRGKYADQAKKCIYICKFMWTAGKTDLAVRVHTLTHEMSHLAAKTTDIKYGRKGCQNLAKSDPSEAIKNADSYGYFAQDVLKMPKNTARSIIYAYCAILYIADTVLGLNVL